MRCTLLTLCLLGTLVAVPAAYSQESVRRPVTMTATAGSEISLAVSPSWVFHGTPVTLSADVQSTDGGPAPTGSVSFYAAGFLIATVNLSGHTASFTEGTLNVAPGTYTVTAEYSGDANYKCSTSSGVSVTVSSESNSTSDMAASPSSLPEGAVETLATDVSPNQGGPIPTGIVKFYEIHGTYLGEATLIDGVATLSVSTAGVAPGTYQVYSVYQGSSLYEQSTSETDTVVVTAAN